MRKKQSMKQISYCYAYLNIIRFALNKQHIVLSQYLIHAFEHNTLSYQTQSSFCPINVSITFNNFTSHIC